MKRPALGRGLDAILGSPRLVADAEVEPDAQGSGEPLLVDVDKISPGRGQPRRRFDETALDELADSIRANGILQPLLVTESLGRYELIAGERRLRAATRAGLEKVPVIIRRDVRADQLVELALIETVQREDLTPIEQARGYQRLIEEHGYSQEQLAIRVGKSRSAVTNALRLLKLPREICDLVDQGQLSEGHARTLLALKTAAQQIRLAGRVVRDAMSVRQTEELVRRLQETAPPSEATRPQTQVESALRSVEQTLGRSLGTKVRVRGGGERGRIEIDFYSQEELNRLITRLG